MIGFLVLALAVAAGVTWFLLRRKPTRSGGSRGAAGPSPIQAPGRAGGKTAAAPLTPDEHLAQLRRDGSIWGVMMRIPAGQGCAAVHELKDKRLALERAPKLPLKGCDAAQCNCGYVALRERRRRDVLPEDGADRRNVGRVKWDQDL